jgi:hypothetical protein
VEYRKIRLAAHHTQTNASILNNGATMKLHDLMSLLDDAMTIEPRIWELEEELKLRSEARSSGKIVATTGSVIGEFTELARKRSHYQMLASGAVSETLQGIKERAEVLTTAIVDDVLKVHAEWLVVFDQVIEGMITVHEFMTQSVLTCQRMLQLSN